MTQTSRLVIVRRNQFATFAWLAQSFASEPNVRLVWDRRHGERRRASAPPVASDLRGPDRRRADSLARETSDYLLLEVSDYAAQAATNAAARNATELRGTAGRSAKWAATATRTRVPPSPRGSAAELTRRGEHDEVGSLHDEHGASITPRILP